MAGAGAPRKQSLHPASSLHAAARAVLDLPGKFINNNKKVGRGRSVIKFIDAEYLGQPYVGETCLHFAVANDDLSMVQVEPIT